MRRNNPSFWCCGRIVGHSEVTQFWGNFGSALDEKLAYDACFLHESAVKDLSFSM